MSVDLFIYATLKNKKVREKVTHEEIPMRPAVLKGYSRVPVPGKDEYTLEKDSKGEVKGDIIRVSFKELKEFDEWEDTYKRRRVYPEGEAGPVFAYFCKDLS